MKSRRPTSSVLALSALALTTLLWGAGCGRDISTPWSGPSPDAPRIDPGGVWNDPAPCPSATPTPSSTPSPDPSPSPSPSPSPTPSPSWWCKTFPWWPWCPHTGLVASANLAFADVSSTCSPNNAPVVHNTNYCKVDDSGKIIASDQLFARDEGGGVHSGGGGCIARPIRDVWGVYFNNPVMQPDDVDEYTATARPDLIPPSAVAQILFVFDLYNVHHVPLINPSWTVRWYHAVQHGTFDSPNEISINFQKVEGTSYIRKLEGGYVLDRVTDNVTSWVMDQNADAERYDTDKANHDVVRMFERVRTGASAMPAAPMH